MSAAWPVLGGSPRDLLQGRNTHTCCLFHDALERFGDRRDCVTRKVEQTHLFLVLEKTTMAAALKRKDRENNHDAVHGKRTAMAGAMSGTTQQMAAQFYALAEAYAQDNETQHEASDRLPPVRVAR